MAPVPNPVVPGEATVNAPTDPAETRPDRALKEKEYWKSFTVV